MLTYSYTNEYESTKDVLVSWKSYGASDGYGSQINNRQTTYGDKFEDSVVGRGQNICKNLIMYVCMANVNFLIQNDDVSV